MANDKRAARPVYLVAVEDGYIARDLKGPAMLVVEHGQKKAGRFPLEKARSIRKIIGGRVVRLVRKDRILTIKAPSRGFDRQWWRCRKCKNVMQYIYQPHSLSNPIITTCHGFGERDYGCDVIFEEDAIKALREKWDRVVVEKKEGK